MLPKMEIDFLADAIYIYLSDGIIEYTKELDEDCYIDYTSNGIPVGMELLNVSNKIDIIGLPDQNQIKMILNKFNERDNEYSKT